MTTNYAYRFLSPASEGLIDVDALSSEQRKEFLSYITVSQIESKLLVNQLNNYYVISWLIEYILSY